MFGPFIWMALIHSINSFISSKCGIIFLEAQDVNASLLNFDGTFLLHRALDTRSSIRPFVVFAKSGWAKTIGKTDKRDA